MISAIQSQAFFVTKDRQYIDRAAAEMVIYLDKIQRPNGLFYHAEDVPFFWGRGNGWMAAGMTELLGLLPKDNPNHVRFEIIQENDGYFTPISERRRFMGTIGR